MKKQILYMSLMLIAAPICYAGGFFADGLSKEYCQDCEWPEDAPATGTQGTQTTQPVRGK